MLHFIVSITTLVLLVASPAVAQQSDGAGQAIGNILSSVLGSDSRLQGHVVLATGPHLIFRGDDGRTYTVDMAALPAADWRDLQPGDSVALVAKKGSNADTLIARRIQPNSSAPRAAYRTAHGTVQSVTGSEATLRTAEGRMLTLDLSSLPRTSRPTPNQPATIVYEQQRGTRRGTALWVQPETASSGTQPSASVPTTPYDGSTASSRSGYQRIHGFVESLGVSSLTLKADNGETIAVDTRGLDRQTLASTRPGDVVSVVGQMSGNSFRASVLQKE